MNALTFCVCALIATLLVVNIIVTSINIIQNSKLLEQNNDASTVTPTVKPHASIHSVSPTLKPFTSIPSFTMNPSSQNPSESPTSSMPTANPFSSIPSKSPSVSPTSSKPSKSPSVSPTSSKPSKNPSVSPTSSIPTMNPSSSFPSGSPSGSPTSSIPTITPTACMPGIVTCCFAVTQFMTNFYADDIDYTSSVIQVGGDNLTSNSYFVSFTEPSNTAVIAIKGYEWSPILVAGLRLRCNATRPNSPWNFVTYLGGNSTWKQVSSTRVPDYTVDDFRIGWYTLAYTGVSSTPIAFTGSPLSNILTTDACGPNGTTPVIGHKQGTTPRSYYWGLRIINQTATCGTDAPIPAPTLLPVSVSPTTSKPTMNPSSQSPSVSPTSSMPTMTPSSSIPSRSPSVTPTSSMPTMNPSSQLPSQSPSSTPSHTPTTSKPTFTPSFTGSTPTPSFAPLTTTPSVTPTSSQPTLAPSSAPLTTHPTVTPTSSQPTFAPSSAPLTTTPTVTPTNSKPSVTPSSAPLTTNPTVTPTSSKPTFAPSSAPLTTNPSATPTSSKPSFTPSSTTPSVTPSRSPTSSKPTFNPSNPDSTLPPSLVPTSNIPSLNPTSTTPTVSPTSSTPTTVPTTAVYYQQGAKFIGYNHTTDSEQGFAVSISADGNVMASGGFTDDYGVGCVWIFYKIDGAWQRNGPKLLGSNRDGASLQGYSVSLNEWGNILAVGGPNDDYGRGSVWMYAYNGSFWNQQGPKFNASGVTRSSRFGSVVSLDYTGTTLVVAGSDYHGISGIWVFTYIAGVWSQNSSTIQVPCSKTQCRISGDGLILVAGNSCDNSGVGAVSVYTQNYTDWIQKGSTLVGEPYIGTPNQGVSVGVSYDGSVIVSGAYSDNNLGSVYVFNKTGGVWIQGAKIVEMYYGDSVAISRYGDILVFSAVTNIALVWVFQNLNNVWTQVQELSANDCVSCASGVLTVPLSISGDGSTVVFGGSHDNENTDTGESAGATWIFERQLYTFTPTTPTSSIPTAVPTYNPSISTPSLIPTFTPTSLPTILPTSLPTILPTSLPTHLPTSLPTHLPTIKPSKAPTTSVPSSSPSFSPSKAPTSSIPSKAPISSVPSKAPTSSVPSKAPSSSVPSFSPSKAPTSSVPSKSPTSSVPSKAPSSSVPSKAPSSSVPSQAPTRSISTPTLQQQGSKLIGNSSSSAASQGSGVSLSSDGNTLVVGGATESSGIGAAWVFTRSSSVWRQQSLKLVASPYTGTPNQGSCVGISRDGSTIVVGGSKDNTNFGAVWIYVKSSGVWTQQGSKIVPTGNIGTTLYFGFSCALSSDGNTLVVGGYGDNSNSGAAWMFTRSGTTWSQQGKAVGSSISYAGSVAISDDGNTLALGGNFDTSGVGAVYIYVRSGGVWTAQGSKIVATSGESGNAKLGQSVALSADGNTLAAGGFLDNSNMGAVWIFTRSGSTWTQFGSKLVGTGNSGNAQQGSAVALNGNGDLVSFSGYFDNTNIGATWIFVKISGVWTQKGSKLVGTSSVGTPEQGWVGSLALNYDGTTMAVGGELDGSTTIGATWVFA